MTTSRASPNPANGAGVRLREENAPQVAPVPGIEVGPVDGIERIEERPASEAEEKTNNRNARNWFVGVIVFLVLAIAAVGGGIGGTLARDNKNASQIPVQGTTSLLPQITSPVSSSTTAVIPQSTSSPSPTSTAPLPQNTSYNLGCFYNDGYLALRESRNTDPHMTPQLCGTTCKGFVYYGVEDGNICLCGNVLHDGYPRTQDGDCDSLCGGNFSLTCGGAYRLQVYTTSPTVTGPPAVNYTYDGCFEDQWARALPNFFKGDSRMSPVLCAGFCQHYNYMGLEYGTQCFCGSSWPGTYTKAPDSDCNATCGGNETLTCGATWRLSLYIIGT